MASDTKCERTVWAPHRVGLSSLQRSWRVDFLQSRQSLACFARTLLEIRSPSALERLGEHRHVIARQPAPTRLIRLVRFAMPLFFDEIVSTATTVLVPDHSCISGNFSHHNQNNVCVHICHDYHRSHLLDCFYYCSLVFQYAVLQHYIVYDDYVLSLIHNFLSCL